METSPLVYRANQQTGFYMTGISVMKELKQILLYRQYFLLSSWFNITFFQWKHYISFSKRKIIQCSLDASHKLMVIHKTLKRSPIVFWKPYIQSVYFLFLGGNLKKCIRAFLELVMFQSLLLIITG